MTASKRDDIGSAEDEPEPKIPRNEEEQAVDVVDDTTGNDEEAKQPEEENDEPPSAADATTTETGESSEPPKKRDKAQGYMTFPGRRHPRVGGDFQVESLPSPSDEKKDEKGIDDSNNDKSKD